MISGGSGDLKVLEDLHKDGDGLGTVRVKMGKEGTSTSILQFYQFPVPPHADVGYF